MFNEAYGYAPVAKVAVDKPVDKEWGRFSGMATGGNRHDRGAPGTLGRIPNLTKNLYRQSEARI